MQPFPTCRNNILLVNMLQKYHECIIFMCLHHTTICYPNITFIFLYLISNQLCCLTFKKDRAFQTFPKEYA